MPNKEQHPNILWLATDEQRCDSLGCYGSAWAHTPNLDRLAREGIVFSNAVTPAPVCGPTRASWLTGRYPSQLGIWHNLTSELPEVDHLTDLFHAAGYRSASFGREHWCFANKPFNDVWVGHLSPHAGHFDYAPEYDEADYDVVKYPHDPYRWIFGGRLPGPASDMAEAQAVERAKTWLGNADGSDPFFLRVNFNAPHTPVVVPEPFDTIIAEDAVTFPSEVESPSPGEPAWISEHLRQAADAACLTPEAIRKMRRYYYGQVAFVDHLFGDLLDWMDARGLLDNTIVAFTADHGTHLGDFGLVQKQTFFEPSVTVPYFFRFPRGFAQGHTLSTPVETRSLMPTLLDAAGIETPEWCRDQSLLESLQTGQEPESRPVFSEFTLASFPSLEYDDPLVMVREGDWKLSLCLGPEPHDGTLVNLADDPYERRNLYNKNSHESTRARLTERVLRHLGRT